MEVNIMDISFIVIVGTLIAIVGYAVYDSTKPGSGVRARNEKGHYIKDDPTTAKNEAFVDGKTPPKKKKEDLRSKSQGRSKSKSKHRANLSDEEGEPSQEKAKKESVGFFGWVFGRKQDRESSKNRGDKSPTRGHSLDSTRKPKRNRSNSS